MEMDIGIAVSVGDLVVIDFRKPVVGGDGTGVGKDKTAHGIGHSGVFFHTPVVDFQIVVNSLFEVEDGGFGIAHFFALTAVKDVSFGDIAVTGLSQNVFHTVLNIFDSHKTFFDFGSTEEVYIKIYEEIDEIKEAVKTGEHDAIEEELGDLLLTVTSLARKLGVGQIATHVGFIPEDPNAEQYGATVEAVRTVAARCMQNGQYFLFETGQETPVTLLRTIGDVGLDNLGVNLDPANLILYGKANPVDALGVIGKYVRDVHAKDGCYPTDGRTLGQETALGEGQVNFPALIEGLRALGYDGAITIEREIGGERQTADIYKAKALIESCIGQ